MMMSSFEEVVLKLNSSPEYVRLFRNSFKGTDDTVISHISISNAIAEYERKLISLNSRFDKNVRGEINDFTAEENLGFNVFMHKGNCGACHYLPMFSGLVPPDYTKSEFENIGTT
jgi:cytochrome c peroxidase